MTMKETSTTEFTAYVLESAIPVLVDFWAPWCNPCRTVAPIIDALALEHAGKLKVYKVNVDKHPDLASQHGIRTIPFFKIFVKGEFVIEFSGARPKSDFDALLTSVID
ncbi:thioredoxin [Klebsiella quasipneumoniae]|uniref:thioredoxin n=1 Tax=Klebsiella quasipneumoniae TaxID=1463165 RepID=UPI001FB5D6BD|nr:thioredoxin [Klebsiella quasipneumoniae]MCJ1848616.1 thioredoxin [Klebsiella quasipneumoniae subsp. similipneumoniae]HBT4804505.1 thioredoxin [Klebsiella quasipneumoniae subsp. similipneumoniae]HCT4300433.1 thioredoxin [Klebsiella quasipneumoniae]